MPVDLERAFRAVAAIHRIPQSEISDFLGSNSSSTPQHVISRAYDFFCRNDGTIALGSELIKRISFVNHVARLLLPGFQITHSSQQDLKDILEGGSIDQIEAWVRANQ